MKHSALTTPSWHTDHNLLASLSCLPWCYQRFRSPGYHSLVNHGPWHCSNKAQKLLHMSATIMATSPALSNCQYKQVLVINYLFICRSVPHNQFCQENKSGQLVGFLAHQHCPTHSGPSKYFLLTASPPYDKLPISLSLYEVHSVMQAWWHKSMGWGGQGRKIPENKSQLRPQTKYKDSRHVV